MELTYREFIELESLIISRIDDIEENLIPRFTNEWLIKSYKKDVRILKGLVRKLNKEVK